MERLTFYRTGNFFTDLGIVSLFDLFASKYSDNVRRDSESQAIVVSNENVEFKLNRDSFEIIAPKKQLTEELVEALERLKERIFSRDKKTKKGEKWWGGAAWTLFGQMKWNDVENSLPKVFQENKNGKPCNLCGQEGRKLGKAGAVELPFTVSLDRFQSFYPSLRGKIQSCGCCRFASWFAARWLHYSLFNGTLNAFCLESNDLLSLYETWSYFSRLFAQRTGFRTYESELSDIQLPYETFTDFLLSAWRLWRQSNLVEVSNALAGKRLHLFSIEGRQEDKTFKKYDIIPSPSNLLSLLERVVYQDSTGKEHQPFLTLIRAMVIRNQNKVDTVDRNLFARACLLEESIHDILEKFLYEKTFVRDQDIEPYKARDILRVFETYQKEVVKMEERVLSGAKSIGQCLGKNMAENVDKSVIYTLRNARSRTDYLESLAQVFTRNIDDITWYRTEVENHLREALDEKNWRVSRSLVLIYMVLSYQQGRQRVSASPETSTTNT